MWVIFESIRLSTVGNELAINCQNTVIGECSCVNATTTTTTAAHLDELRAQKRKTRAKKCWFQEYKHEKTWILSTFEMNLSMWAL